MSNYLLPKKIADVLKNNPQSDNFGLLFSRLQPFKKNSGKKDDKEKYKIWKNLADESRRIFSQDQMRQFLAGTHRRLDNLECAYAKLGFRRFYPNVEMKVDWRLAVGLGNPSVLDTGLRLHSIYGFPYLPASGLKGAVRNTWLNKKAERLGIKRLSPAEIEERNRQTPWKMFENLLISAKSDSQASTERFTKFIEAARINNLDFEVFFQQYVLKYKAIFGNKNGQGSVNFLDVLPTELTIEGESILEVDVINPHYAPYYTSGKPPADWHSPKPIFFLPFRFNTPFRFRILAKNENLLRVVKDLITETARDSGLGAKTMSGYGEMYQDDER